MAITIPIYQPDLSGNERAYVLDCLDTTWISSKGKYVEKFEHEFATQTGARHASGVSNGTVALHVALDALGIGPGDEIIVPTLTYIASVNAITYTGATPVFVDSCANTWQMDPADIEKKITPQTKGIMAVHLYGHPCDMDPITALAQKHELYLIEDCAEAFGTFYKGKPVGSFGQIATYSFFGNKTITTGEGGMVTSDDSDIIARVNHLKGQGLATNREYWHDAIGYNYRMTNICAAIGLAQLERSQDIIAKKRQVSEWYAETLSPLPVTLHHEVGDVIHSYWMVSILTEKAEDRDPLRDFLKQKGVETRPLFYPIHTMPIYSANNKETHPVANDLARRGINLPSWPGLTHDQVSFIGQTIRDYFDA